VNFCWGRGWGGWTWGWAWGLGLGFLKISKLKGETRATPFSNFQIFKFENFQIFKFSNLNFQTQF